MMQTSRQLIHSHPRLLIALVTGLVIALVLPQHLNETTRVLVGWNVMAWSYLLMMGWVITHSDHEKIQKIAAQENNNAVAVLCIMSVAATFSLVAIVLELASVKGLSGHLKLFHYVFTAVTVLGSWLLVGAIYTFHYAHLFYRSSVSQRALRFPDEEPHPDYWDFLYFSFTIAVAAQTSDISIMSRSMRKAVLAQSVLSFLFNAAIIGMSINIAAGMIGT